MRGLDDETFWIRWRVQNPNLRPGREMLNYRYEIDPAELQDFHVHGYGRRQQEQTETLEQRRIRYWIEVDINSNWCFLCQQTRSVQQAQRFKEYQTIVNYATKNISEMSPVTLYEHIQSMHEVLVVPQQYRLTMSRWQNKNIVPMDPDTDLPKPPHYWTKRAIHNHFTSHIMDATFNAEYKIKKYNRIGDYLADTSLVVGEDGQTLYNEKKLKLMIEVDKMRQAMERQVVPQRAARRAEIAQQQAQLRSRR